MTDPIQASFGQTRSHLGSAAYPVHRTIRLCDHCRATGYDPESSDDPNDESFGRECPACDGEGTR